MSLGLETTKEGKKTNNNEEGEKEKEEEVLTIDRLYLYLFILYRPSVFLSDPKKPVNHHGPTFGLT